MTKSCVHVRHPTQQSHASVLAGEISEGSGCVGAYELNLRGDGILQVLCVAFSDIITAHCILGVFLDQKHFSNFYFHCVHS